MIADDPLIQAMVAVGLIIYVAVWVGLFLRGLVAKWWFENDDDDAS